VLIDPRGAAHFDRLIAQMRTSSPDEASGAGGHHLLDEADGKRIKTDAGERFVPVHQDIIKIGFLAYVDRMRRRYKMCERWWTLPEVPEAEHKTAQRPD
jgi:hypothetical protein